MGDEQRTITTTRLPLWHNVLHTFGSSVVAMAAGLLFSIVTTRVLGPEGKGSYDLTIATVGLLSIFLGLSLPSGITYALARGTLFSRGLIGLLVLVTLVQVVLAGAGLYLARGAGITWLSLAAETSASPSVVVLCLFALTMLAGYWRSALVGLQQIVRANQVDVITKVGLAALACVWIGLVTWRGGAVSVASLLWLTVAVLLAGNILALALLKASITSSSAPLGWASILGYALTCYAGNLVQFLNYRLDLFIIGFLSGVAAAGFYSLAVSLAQMQWLLSSAIAGVLMPSVASNQHNPAENARRAAQATRVTLWTSVAVAGVTGAVAPVLVPPVFGAPFRESVAPLLWLLPGVAIFSTVNVLAAYIGGIGRPRVNLYIALLGLCATVPLDLLLVPLIGIVGAALASTISYTLSAIATVWFFVRVSGVSLAATLLVSREDWQFARSVARRGLRAVSGQGPAGNRP